MRNLEEGGDPHMSSIANCEGLEGTVSISMPQRVEGHKRRTLSLILGPLAATGTGVAEPSMYLNRLEDWGYPPSSIPSSSLPAMQGSRSEWPPTKCWGWYQC
jgi:hypothetical protein